MKAILCFMRIVPKSVSAIEQDCEGTTIENAHLKVVFPLLLFRMRLGKEIGALRGRHE